MTDSPLYVQAIGAGESALPPIVLLHGFASSGTADFVAAGWSSALSAAGRTGYVVDLPGHGGSAAVESAEAGRTHSVVAGLAQVVEKIAEQAHTVPSDRSGAAPSRRASTGAVDVVGYSLGARLAWELPAASGERVRRLVLGGISPFEPFTAVDLGQLRASIGSPLIESPAAENPVAESPLTTMMAAMIQAPGRDSASLANLIEGLAAEPFAPTASAPSVPTLFIAGTTDAMSGGIEELVGLVAGAALQRVPGDHRGALESARFRAAALEFLG